MLRLGVFLLAGALAATASVLLWRLAQGLTWDRGPIKLATQLVTAPSLYLAGACYGTYIFIVLYMSKSGSVREINFSVLAALLIVTSAYDISTGQHLTPLQTLGIVLVAAGAAVINLNR